MKNYKELEPEVTIGVIKGILSEAGIVTRETYIDNFNFHSCRVCVGNSALSPLNIGTNGKGRSFEYSLASGYAELMERLQNNLILFNRRFATKDFLKDKPVSYVNKLEKENLTFDYYYDRDERLADIDEVIETCGDSLITLINMDSKEQLYDFLLKEYGQDGYLMIPFYSVFEKKEIYLPINVVLTATGSNGMAAGNTNKEACLQGLCEIFERYAISKIHNGELTPPTIPFEYFEGKPVFEKLQYLVDKTNYKIIIKDCSLGKGFPVIGIMIIDAANQRYNLKVASDFVPEIALERTINEIYQGVRYFKSIPFELLTLDEISSKRGANSAQINLERIFVNGSGFWPLSVFSEKESYKFKGFNEDWGKSNENDLKYSFNLAKEVGTDVFIRNNSRLGFPTFYIVVPRLSQIVECHKSDSYHERLSEIVGIRELGSLNREKIEELSKLIDANYNIIKYRELDYTKFYLPNINLDLLDLDLELLEFMLLYYIGDYTKALYYLQQFLTDKDFDEYQYYYSVSDFVNLKWIKRFKSELIKAVLDKKYSEELTRELFEDFSNPEMIFQYHKLPNCFNCDDCDLKDDCSLLASLRIEKRLEGMSVNSMRQLDLCSDFECFN